MSHPEVRLSGGNVAEVVVRVGNTVRKPWTRAAPAVHSFLDHLHRTGFTGAPRALGRDTRDRQVLEFVDGPMAHDLPPMNLDELGRIGALVRALHDASVSYVPPARAHWETIIRPDRENLICHHDLAPWNLVCGPDRWVFIDWDGAGPSSRLWDLAYAAQSFASLAAGGDPAVDGPRLRTLADGYGLTAEQRRAVPPILEARTRAMHDLLVEGARTGRQPWARLHAEGHADYWGPAAAYIGAHQPAWRHALTKA